MFFALPFSFSLLAKELIELAAYKRTYVLRTLYALGLFTLFLVMSYQHFASLNAGDMESLGSGGILFNNIMMLQFCGIYLFLPLLVAPLICEEDERGSLDLLLVSGISPLEFLLQKLISRLISMGSFLLLGLPISGVAYSLGGISHFQLFAGAYSLLLCCIQVASVALWCGAKSHTSMKALSMTYLHGPLMLFLFMPLIFLIPMLILDAFLRDIWAPGSFIIPMSLYYNTQQFNAAAGWSNYLGILLAGLPILLSAALFIILAWRALINRRLEMSSTMKKQMKIYRPGIQFELHRRRRVVAMGADMESLPGKNSLSWREIRKTPVFRKEHRKYILFGVIIIGIITGANLIFPRNVHHNNEYGPFLSLGNFVYILAIPLIAILTSGLISGERKRNSLEVLLLTPLSGRELISSKLSGCKRMAWMGFSLITYFSIIHFFLSPFNAIAFWQLIFFVFTAYIYLQLAMWLSMAVSLRMRAQIHAAITVLIIIIAWIALPLLAIQLYIDVSQEVKLNKYWVLLYNLSPASILYDQYENKSSPIWSLRIISNLALYGAILYFIRWHCLKHADALLGRAK